MAGKLTFGPDQIAPGIAGITGNDIFSTVFREFSNPVRVCYQLTADSDYVSLVVGDDTFSQLGVV
jgi:hypothetical protein